MLNLSESLPSRLRELRTERGWSLAELADRAGTTASQVMKLEKGQRRLNLLWIARFADAFEISESELMGQEEEMVYSPSLIPVVKEIVNGDWKTAVIEQEGMVEAIVDSISQSGFALRTTNNIMDAIIPDGGYMVVDPEEVELRQGKIYLVVDGSGKTTAARFKSDPARLERCSTKQDQTPISLGRDPFFVIGLVKGAWVNL